MRITLIALLFISATHVTAESPMQKTYPPEVCEKISGTIDFLLELTAQHWDKLGKQPKNEKAALELSWTMDLAANYTTIYTAFCEKSD